NEIPEENFNHAIDILEGLSDEEIQKIADTEEEGLSKLAEQYAEPKTISETDVKQAELEHEKAQHELKNAEDKLAKEQGKQSDMFAGGTQKGLFSSSRDDSKDILDPLKTKVKETKAALDKIQNDFNNQNDNAPSLFQVREPSSKEVNAMKDIVKDLQDEGINDLKTIQDIAAKELGDNSTELKNLVEDAYHEAGKELDISKGGKNELTTSFAKRINNFVDKIFGKSNSPEGHTVVLKDSKAVEDAARNLGNGIKFQMTMPDGSKKEVQTVNADVVNGFYS